MSYFWTYPERMPNPGAIISTNSTTFVDADVTLNVAIDISSDRLLCIAVFEGSKATGGHAYYDLIVNQDGSTDVRAGDATLGLAKVVYHANYHYQKTVVLVGYWTGLQPGTKTVRLQMRSSNANYANIEPDQLVVMTAFEV